MAKQKSVLHLPKHLAKEAAQAPEVVVGVKEISGPDALKMIQEQQTKLVNFYRLFKRCDQELDKANKRAEKATQVAARLAAELKQTTEFYKETRARKTHDHQKKVALLKMIIACLLHQSQPVRVGSIGISIARPFDIALTGHWLTITESENAVTAELHYAPDRADAS